MFKINFSKILGVCTVLFIILFSIVSCKCDKKIISGDDSDSTKVDSSTLNIAGKYDSLKGWIYDVGAEKEIVLPNGVKIKAGANSSEAKIVKLLSDVSYNPSDTTKSFVWTTLDRVYFETGKDILTAESEIQVKNIAEILKAYPKAELKIGGYTDNSGNSDINKKVSTARANAVSSKLISLGIPVTNVSSEGFGSEFPVCEANDTPECKAQNRRVDVRIKSK